MWVESEIRNLEFIPKLDVLAKLIREAVGAHVWFVEILGNRWSYIAGEVNEQPSTSRLCRTVLRDNMGMVVESWGILSRDDRKRFFAFVNRLIAD